MQAVNARASGDSTPRTPAHLVPDASVIIPARNAAGTIGRQLLALAGQTGPETIEIIVVDDSSTDSTRRVVESFRTSLPGLRLVSAAGEGIGVNRARNSGRAHSRGDLLLFCDADDMVAPTWVSSMTRALRNAPAVGGYLERRALNSAAAIAARPPTAKPDLSDAFGFLQYPWGANCGVRRDLFDDLNGFDPSYGYGSDDVEFFWRAQLSGAELRFVPEALVHYQLRSAPLDILRQTFRYGRSHPKLYRQFATSGMPPSGLGGAVTGWARIAARSWHLLAGSERRTAWLARLGVRAGRIRGSLKHRVLYL